MKANWQIENVGTCQKQIGKYARKHFMEVADVLEKLEKYIVCLEGHNNLALAAQLPFVHSEGKRLLAIASQRSKRFKATRLYFYPDQEARVVYLLGIGNKETQGSDIRCGHQLIERLEADKAENI